MAHIPTDPTMKRLGHDVSNLKHHALRYMLLERCRRLPPPLPKGGYRRSAGFGCASMCVDC
jgi:hypothetical protein